MDSAIAICRPMGTRADANRCADGISLFSSSRHKIADEENKNKHYSMTCM
jgi:hypothetical protein